MEYLEYNPDGTIKPIKMTKDGISPTKKMNIAIHARLVIHIGMFTREKETTPASNRSHAMNLRIENGTNAIFELPPPQDVRRTS